MIRKIFKDFLNNRSNQKILVMPIAKTSFAATCYDKEWTDQVSYKECVSALKDCGVVPSIMIGEKEYFDKKHPLGFNFVLKEQTDKKKVYNCKIQTKLGEIAIEQTFISKQTGVLTKNILHNENGLKKLCAYLYEVYDNIKAIKENISEIRRAAGEECIIQFFLPQPFEIYCLAGREEAVYLKYDEDEDFLEVKKATLRLVLKLIEEISASGEIDCFLFGSAGSELYSPELFDEEFFEVSKTIIQAAKQYGMPIIYHACGNMKALVEKSKILQLKPDIFEGMAFPPAGDLSPFHIDKMDKDIALRGNIDLGLLRNGAPEEIAGKVQELIKLFPGRKVILSGSCDILYGTPTENIKALKNFKG